MARAGTAIHPEELALTAPASRESERDARLYASAFPRCAFCGEPLPFTAMGVKAWRVGERFFCNEFCAESAPL